MLGMPALRRARARARTAAPTGGAPAPPTAPAPGTGDQVAGGDRPAVDGRVPGVSPPEPSLLGPIAPLSLRAFSSPPALPPGAARPATDLLGSGSPTDAAAAGAAAALRRRWGITRRAIIHCVRWAAERWRASLQLRVAATTVLLSSLVVFVVGMLSVGTITAGVLDGKRQAAHAEVRNGLAVAQQNLAAGAGEESISIDRTRAAVFQAIANRGTAAGLFSIVVISDNAGPFVSEQGRVEDVPVALRQEVERGRFADIYAPVEAPGGGATKGLVVGAPVTRQPGAVELYYIFPLQAEQRTVGLVRNTVLLTGILLVALLAAVAALVTGQVVRPVRVAATIAERFAAGRLQERMQVRGTDDLAALAAAFNDMADSLQGQITKLEEMSRLQRRFTSDVSHELRTPLTTIRMATDVLHASRGDFEPQVARSAELLENELDRFEALLADLLEISRYDAHVAELEPDPLDLRGLVRSAIGTTEAVARQAGVEVRVDMPDEPVVADVDGRRVERILRNLMVNAIEHSEGRPVEVRLRGDERAVAVTVRDHGVGLRPGEAALVFDRFWRADPSRDRRTGGTGLGLSISLEDARLHGGWLHAWGRPGRGAQFRLTVPVRSGETVVSSPLPIEPPDATRPARLARPVDQPGRLA